MLARHYGPKKIPCLESLKNTSASQGGGVCTKKLYATNGRTAVLYVRNLPTYRW